LFVFILFTLLVALQKNMNFFAKVVIFRERTKLLQERRLFKRLQNVKTDAPRFTAIGVPPKRRLPGATPDLAAGLRYGALAALFYETLVVPIYGALAAPQQ
jgi:hypothetical protein